MMWRLCFGAAALYALLIGTAPVMAQGTPLERGFSASPDVALRIYLPKGRLRVSTWSRDSVHVRGTVGASGTYFGGGTPAHVKFGVEPRTPGDTRLPDADWVVQVPPQARLWIKQVEGDLEVTGLRGELEAYTVGGRMVVRQVTGQTTLESIDAPVTVEAARGDLRIRGSKGAVALRDVNAVLSVGTVSGTVTVTGGRPDGRIETIGGAVVVEGPELRDAELEVQTHSGTITLRVDPRRAPKMELSTRAGAPTGAPLTGQTRFGRLVARSFKGAILVQSLPQ